MKKEPVITFISLPQQEKILYLLMIVFSVILSVIEIQGSVINRDAIVYLSTAEAFLEQGASGAFQTYNWPFYAIFGALLSKATNIPLENCFYIINTTLYAIAPVIFLRLYTVVTNGRNTLTVAALLVLLLPSFNNYRDMIIRDIGFWCFSLIALLSFVRFIQTKRISHAVSWQLAIGIAFLFRSEALAWIIALPLSLFWINRDSFIEKIQCWLLSISFYLGTLGIAAVFFLINNGAFEASYNKVPSAHAFTNAFEGLKISQQGLAEHVLNDYSIKHALLIMTAGLLAHFTYTILSTTSFIYLALASTAFLKGYTINASPENRVVYWALGLNLLTLVIFLLSQQFMIERYAVLSGLLILLLISQPIGLWAKKAWPPASKLIKCSFIFVALAVLADLLISSNPPPTNLKSAGKWIQTNIDINTPIALNDNRLLHYSGRLRQGTTCIIDKDLNIISHSLNELKPYSYLVLQARKDLLPSSIEIITRETSFEKIEEFVRGRSTIIIFKNAHPSNDHARDCNPFR